MTAATGFDDLKMKFFSIMLGLGMASIFRQVCKDDKCRIVKGPDIKELERNMYRIDDKCYRYKPSVTMCDV